MITLNDHRKKVTKTLIAVFSDDKTPKLGLSSLFPSVTTESKLVSIEVERNKQLVAVDVQRCTDPVRNTFSNFTEKIFEPPYYNESFDFTSCQRYDVTFGAGQTPTKVDLTFLLKDAKDKLMVLKNKILRAIEKQRSEVLHSGIVKLKNGDSIDYKRKAESMPVLTGTDVWTNSENCKPLTDLENGMEFLRNEGLSGGSVVNAIFGRKALQNFLASKQIKEQAEWKNIQRMQINMPQFDNVSGMVFQGQIATTDYLVNIWSYNDNYVDPSDNATLKPYINPNAVVLASDDFVGKTAFAGVPAILGDAINGQYVAPLEGEFYVRDVIDQIKLSWLFMISSAPLVIPVSVDRIYTILTAPEV